MKICVGVCINVSNQQTIAYNLYVPNVGAKLIVKFMKITFFGAKKRK